MFRAGLMAGFASTPTRCETRTSPYCKWTHLLVVSIHRSRLQRQDGRISRVELKCPDDFKTIGNNDPSTARPRPGFASSTIHQQPTHDERRHKYQNLTQGFFPEIPPPPLTNKSVRFLEKWSVQEPCLQVADVIEQEHHTCHPRETNS